MLPRFRSVLLLLWFVLLICTFSALSIDRAEAEEALTSWYGPELQGLPTASGEPFDASGYTAAHKTLPLGTKLVVSYKGRSVPVTVNDRGPYVGDRELDLSQGAARELGLTQAGIYYMEYSFADDDNSYVADYPNYLQRYTSTDTNNQASALESANSISPDDRGSSNGGSDGLDSDGFKQSYEVVQGVGADPQANTHAAPLNVDNNSPQDNYFGSEEVGINSANQPAETLQDVEHSPQMNIWAGAPNSANNISLEASYGDDAGYGANYPGYLGAYTPAWNEVNGGTLGILKGPIQDPGLATAAQDGANSEAYVVRPNGIDSNFIRRQEGFRLDGYVPDPGFSRSGATVGTGVDIGQLSVADIEALGIPQELKQKLKPYAGLTGQDAVYFLNNHPLHLTEDEANALDWVVTQKTIDELTRRYNATASGKSFTELPSEAQTVIADIAFQYGSSLAQRMPNFWSDVTEGRWNIVIQKLRNFGDRYSTRRNAEADLLERAVDRAALGDYVVQPGDTLSKIASQLGTSVEYLAARNGVTDPDTIYSGQVLYY